MRGGDSFCNALSNYISTHFIDNYDRMAVLVPTARVAARVRALLAADIKGVLPAVLPLKGNGEMADLLGIDVGGVVVPGAARIEIAQVLKRIGSGDGEERAALEATRGERLWRRVESLYSVLDRLALYGITAHDLRRTVPANMVGLWEAQASTLLTVASHMERWLARRGEQWPGQAERRVLERAAEILGNENGLWVPVMAGVLDGIPAAKAVMQAVALRGTVLFPQLGAVTDELIAETDVEGERISGVAREVREGVAETEWDEAWLAALGVRRALDAGEKRVAVVSPSRELLRRVGAILGEWNLQVPVRGEMCLDTTPEGRAVLAVSDWGLRGGRAADWLEAMRGHEIATPILTALEPLREVDSWLDPDDWRGVMAQVLGATAAPVKPVSEDILLMGPLDARLMDFETVIAAGCVEGTWPGHSSDTWLSDAHLRALGLPDNARRALLAGTEFESLMMSGSGTVIVTRSKTMDGREAVASRYLQNVANRVRDTELEDALTALRMAAPGDGLGEDGVLGVFAPTGKLWPKRWSASFIEAMLACPYKALGERVLRLETAEPLNPEPDARMAGLLVHRWLERVGAEISSVTEDTAKQVEKRLIELAEFELQHESAVVQAIWRVKFAKLVPVMVARWLADGRQVVAVEKKLAREVGGITVTAKADRVEQGTGGAVIIDFKTSQAAAWSDVAAGVKPQLAIEAWLLGQEETVADIEYWQLRGYGPNPLKVTRPGGRSASLDKVIEPVGDGLSRLAETFDEGNPFPAVPDMAGGGLMATGHCTRCALAGVCRRKEAGMGH